MVQQPSPNGDNGRRPDGRFARGNAGGPGNPHARQSALLRAALMDAVTPADVREIIEALIVRAKEGDIAAAREVLDRTLGKAGPGDDAGDSAPTVVRYQIVERSA